MANAPRDENQVPALLAVSRDDGKTVIRILADPSTHGLNIQEGTGGVDRGPANALRDGNQVTSIIATSSVDGVTPVVIYADAQGNLLTKST